jgi:hypothetical protein
LGSGYIAIELDNGIAKQMMDNLRVEGLLVTDMVVNGGLVYTGAIRDFVAPAKPASENSFVAACKIRSMVWLRRSFNVKGGIRGSFRKNLTQYFTNWLV